MLKKQIGKYNHYKTDDWHYLYYYIINNGAMYKKIQTISIITNIFTAKDRPTMIYDEM
ncbi:MAG: hypothetical protein II453_08055 [Alphaproteobacteria bacterium]|nr:hypothetical protein [Alphaproteobacteria bacterium]